MAKEASEPSLRRYWIYWEAWNVKLKSKYKGQHSLRMTQRLKTMSEAEARTVLMTNVEQPGEISDSEPVSEQNPQVKVGQTRNVLTGINSNIKSRTIT